MFKDTRNWKRPKAIQRLTCDTCGHIFIRRCGWIEGIYGESTAFTKEAIYHFNTVACPTCDTVLYFGRRHQPFSEWKTVSIDFRKHLMGHTRMRWQKSNLGIALERNPLDY